MIPKKQKLTIYQGTTFRFPFYWYSDVEVSKAITAVACTYPTVVTAVNHGLPDSEIPVAILDVGTWVNTASVEPEDRIYATKIDTDTFSLRVDGTGQRYTGSAGRVVYNVPMALATWSARMQIRASVDDATVIEEFTSPTQIVLNDDGLVAPTLTDADTDALTFDSAVYDIELVDPNTNEVTRLAYGPVVLSLQVTRTP